jgi:hypothetical protein
MSWSNKEIGYLLRASHWPFRQSLTWSSEIGNSSNSKFKEFWFLCPCGPLLLLLPFKRSGFQTWSGFSPAFTAICQHLFSVVASNSKRIFTDFPAICVPFRPLLLHEFPWCSVRKTDVILSMVYKMWMYNYPRAGGSEFDLQRKQELWCPPICSRS